MTPHRQTLDEDSASRMLQGAVHPDDAPPGYAPVAGLLARAAHLTPLDEDAGAATISAMVEAIRAGAPTLTSETSRRKSMTGRLFAGKALAVIATVTLTATGAAAATGSLPAPVQDVVSEAVSHVGVDLPAKGGKSAGHRQDGEHRQPDENKPDENKPDGNKPDALGQSGDDHGQPAGHGEDSGDNNGKGSEISDLTHDPALDGLPKGPVVSDVASDGKSQAGDGQPAGGEGEDEHTPPVTTGGKSTGAEHSRRDLEPQGKGSGEDS